jgi:hypothetical protein
LKDATPATNTLAPTTCKIDDKYFISTSYS